MIGRSSAKYLEDLLSCLEQVTDRGGSPFLGKEWRVLVDIRKVRCVATCGALDMVSQCCREQVGIILMSNVEDSNPPSCSRVISACKVQQSAS